MGKRMNKNPVCNTCGEPIVWLSRRGWVHWATRENSSATPIEHNAFIKASGTV